MTNFGVATIAYASRFMGKIAMRKAEYWEYACDARNLIVVLCIGSKQHSKSNIESSSIKVTLKQLWWFVL